MDTYKSKIPSSLVTAYSSQSLCLCLRSVVIKYHIPYPSLSLSLSVILSFSLSFTHSIHMVTQVRFLAYLILLLTKIGSFETPDSDWTNQNPIHRPQLLARCEWSKV